MTRAWPIRFYLYVIVLVTATPLCLYIAHGLLRESEEAELQAEQLVRSLASSAAAVARNRITEVELFASALAKRPLVRVLDPSRCDPLVTGLLPLVPHYANISVIDTESRFVCSALPLASPGQTVPPHGGVTGALAGRFAVSAPLMGILPKRLVVSAGYPVRDDSGHVVGAVTVPIDLALIQPVSEPAALPRNARVRIIDRTGVLLASSVAKDPELGRNLRGHEVIDRVLNGSSRAIRARGTDGVQRIYAHAEVGVNGWRAHAGVPVDEVLASARQRIVQSALIAAAMLAVGLLAAARVAQRIARRASALERAMDETAAGRRVYAPVGGPREMHALANNFNRMLDATLEAQRALQESEARLRLAVRASHTGLWDWDVNTDRVFYSPEWKRQLGYDEGEISDNLSEWTERLHPDERETVIARQQRRIESGHSDYENEFRLRHRDGSYRWIYSRAEMIRDEAGTPRRMLGSHIDITDRKHLEQTLQRTVAELRVLSMRLIEVEETERRAISRELHDRTGANIAALQITVRLLADKLRSGKLEGAADLAHDAGEVLAQTSREIRDIMSELRPAALDDFGLYPALLTYARNVSSRLGIELETSGGPIEPRPPSAVETALFRIAQEALTNIAKHGHAATVRIGLERRDGHVILSIADDGAGFDPEKNPRGGRHGMRTMRERADAVGGVLSVSSSRGGGTRITVEVPLT